MRGGRGLTSRACPGLVDLGTVTDMRLDFAQIQYLKKTLGVEAVLMPKAASANVSEKHRSGLAASESADSLSRPNQAKASETAQIASTSDHATPDSKPAFDLDGQKEAAFYVLASTDVSNEAKSLLSNILKAMGDGRMCILRVSDQGVFAKQLLADLKYKTLLVFPDLCAGVGLEGLRVGQALSEGSNRIMLTGDLSPMLSKNQQQVQTQKRMVWGHLKPLTLV